MLDERTNDELVTFSTAPSNTLMLPPSSTALQLMKEESTIFNDAPETWRAAETDLLLHITLISMRAMPEHPMPASQEILLLILRRMVYGDDGTPTMVSEHGSQAREHRSADQSHDTPSVTRTMSSSYILVKEVKPKDGQAWTAGKNNLNNSPEEPESVDPPKR
jgi:hypothetical protein